MTRRRGAACELDETGCITCGDQGIVMRVAEIRDQGALCSDGDGRSEVVAIDLLDDVAVGASLLVHAGVAIGFAR